jgi:hypothetical protein
MPQMARTAVLANVQIAPLVSQKLARISELEANIARDQAELNQHRSDVDKIRASLKDQGAPEPIGEQRQRRRRRRRAKSSTALAMQVLQGANGHEAHVDDLVSTINERFHVRVKKQSLVSALARMAKRKDTFYRTDTPNTFGLLR